VVHVALPNARSIEQHRKVAAPKDEKKAQAKLGKAARFDPENQLTVAEQQAARQKHAKKKRRSKDDKEDGSVESGQESGDAEGEEKGSGEDSANESDFDDDVEDEEAAGEDESEEEDEDEDDEEDGSSNEEAEDDGGKRKRRSEDEPQAPPRHTSGGGKGKSAVERHSIDALRQRLAQRILDFRASRNLKVCIFLIETACRTICHVALSQLASVLICVCACVFCSSLPCWAL